MTGVGEPPFETGEMMHDTDTANLVQAVLKGDARACERLVRRFYRPCYAVALSVLRHPEDAEDAAQTAMATAFASLERLKDPQRFRPWLMKIVRNRALTLVSARNAAERRRSPVDPETLAVGARNVPVRDDLLRALGHLAEREREVLLLHDLSGLRHREIADALGISETNSRQILFTARTRARASLEGAPQGGTP